MTQGAVQRAAQVFDGSAARLAAAMGGNVARQNVEHWLKTGRVPVEQCTPMERATERRVMRWELRPDDWHLIWPELVGADGAPAVPAMETNDAA